MPNPLITKALAKALATARGLCHDPNGKHTYSTIVGGGIGLQVDRERTLHVGRCAHCDRLAAALLRAQAEALAEWAEQPSDPPVGEHVKRLLAAAGEPEARHV